MIDLYTAATPNGWKATIALEELTLPYIPHFLSLADGEQKLPEFIAINPNGRIPAIVDRDLGGHPIFESGAILIHLAEKAGRLLPTEAKARATVLSWLMWQMGGLGPMMGQLNVFRNYFPEKLPAAIERYDREVNRLFAVLDRQLADHMHVAGADYSIADIACFPWVAGHDWSGVSLDPYPHLERWRHAVAARPAVAKGMTIPPRQTDAERAQAMENAKKILV